MVARNSLWVIIHSSVHLHQFVSHSNILNHRFSSFVSTVSACAGILAGKMADFVAALVMFQEFSCELHIFFMIRSHMIDDTTEGLQILKKKTEQNVHRTESNIKTDFMFHSRELPHGL